MGACLKISQWCFSGPPFHPPIWLAVTVNYLLWPTWFNSLLLQGDDGVLPYPLVEGPNGEACTPAGGEVRRPVDVASLILENLKTMAEAHLGCPVWVA